MFMQIRRLGYYDNRDPNHITVVFISMHDDRIKEKPTLYAKLVYNNDKEICSELEYYGKSWGLSYAQKEFYLNYLLRTKRKEIPHEPPKYALISKDVDCSTIMTQIPIQDDKPKKRFTYGVCLHKGLYDLHEPQLLVDWVELNIALGAEIITVYLQNVSESYYIAMLPYIKEGIVEVLDWNLKPPLIPGYTKHWGQTATISECIFRNLYRVKYLALIDVDEFIVPQEKMTVIELLNELEELMESKSFSPASFIFYNTYVYNDGVSLPEVATATKCPKKAWPRYYTNTKRVANPEKEHFAFHWHKMIAKTKAVNSAWYHWPASIQDGYTNRFLVPAKYGLTLHYRVPELQPRKVSKRNFDMGKYFKQTLKHLQSDCNAPWLDYKKESSLKN